MKPLNRKNYGSIPHLSNSKLGEGDHHIELGQEKILTIKKRDKHDEIFAFEKYDGSNVGICKKDGVIHAITRSGYLANTSQYKQHHEFHEWVQPRRSIFSEYLREGERLCAEWMTKRVSIEYLYDDDNPIIFFDGFTRNNERMLIDESYDLVFNKLDFQYARMLHRGNSISVDSIKPELNDRTFGMWADEDPEGIVYRVERKGKVDFLAKWVREDFEAGKYL